MSLRRQFFVILAACVAALFVFAAVMDSLFVKMRADLLRHAVVAQQAELENRVHAASQRDLQQVSVFTALPEVISAYEVALSGNIDDPMDARADAGREMLRQSMKPYLSGFEAATGKKLKVQFHLPNAASLVRLWTPGQIKKGGEWTDASDPMADFRHMVREKNIEPGPATGIELGRSGFTLHGLVPIAHPQTKKHLGTVEVISGFTPVFTTMITIPERERLALFMNVEQLAVTHDLQDADKYPLVGDKYVTLDAVGEGGSEVHVDAAMLDGGRQSLTTGEHDGVYYGVFPVRDYANQQVGVVLYVPDGQGSAVILRWIRVTMYGGLVVFMLMFGVTGVFFVDRVVVRIAVDLSQRMAAIVEDRADLSSRIPVLGRNEIGQLGHAFNRLLDKVQVMIRRSDRLSTHLMELPAPVYTIDRAGVLRFANAKGLAFLGKTESEALGQHFSSLLLSETATSRCTATRAMAEKRVVTHEHKVQTRVDGDVIPVRITGIPIFDAAGDLDGALLFLVDLSQVYEIVEELQMSAEVLQASSQRLVGAASQLQTGAGRMSQDSDSVLSATHTVAGTLSGIRLSTDEMSMAVSTAAAAVEEMSSTLTEVASNTAKGAVIASDVDSSAHAVGNRVRELSELVASIGQVVGLIDEIAGKTNLVALNATIEGARAGAAGRGFAVVASEVKGLARQTAQATEEIQEKIARVQEAMGATVAEVHNIVEAISELAVMSQTNAAAVEEQSATIKEISATIGTTSSSAEEIAEYVRGASGEADAVARHVQEMGGQISGAVHGAELTHETAEQIAEVTRRMQEIVQRFELK